MKKLALLLCVLSLAACDTTSTSSSAPTGAAAPAARSTTLGSNIPRPADQAPATATYGAGGGEALRDALGRSNR
ncbi:MAG: hypothetical protein JSR82_18280 [Verrucomicrobia bacterium]|nr:hypothetical protein [Verrucomicrobiota bacterium]